MFRRPGKNPLDENPPIYQEEAVHVSPYKYVGKKNENEIASRMYDTPAQPYSSAQRGYPRATPLEEQVQQEESWAHEKTAPLPHHLENLMREEEPETTLGEGVTFRGELSFERLLRIDGTFEGTLLSQGKVIIGPKGRVKADLNLREAIIEGELEGNITVQEKLEIRGEASVKGDIRAKVICVDEGAQILGHLEVIAIFPAETVCPA